jgi:hypothetical protein
MGLFFYRSFSINALFFFHTKLPIAMLSFIYFFSLEAVGMTRVEKKVNVI